MLLAMLFDQVVANLKLRHNCAEIISKTLLLLADLAGGYSSGKVSMMRTYDISTDDDQMMLKLEAVIHHKLR